MRAARESCPNDEVMCQCMPIFQAKGPKIWAWRTLHVEKPADESIDLWIREIKAHGEICWKLIARDFLLARGPTLQRGRGRCGGFRGGCATALLGFPWGSKVVRRDTCLNISNITAGAPKLKMGVLHPAALGRGRKYGQGELTD